MGGPAACHAPIWAVASRFSRVGFALAPLAAALLAQLAAPLPAGLLSWPHVPLAVIEGFSTADLQALLGRWGYLVVFVGMLLENAGLPLPGETLTLLGGYAAGSGQLNLFGVMASAAGGAVLGDNLGYWVGRRAGWGLLLRVGRWLGQGPEQMERLRSGFLRRAGLSVMLGRFVAVLRVLAGPMAGAVGMPYRRFVVCNLAGAVLWAGSMVSLAWLGGRWIPIERMLSGVLQFGLGALLLLTVVVLLPRCLSAWEGRLLERSEDVGPSDGGDAGPAAPPHPDQPLTP